MTRQLHMRFDDVNEVSCHHCWLVQILNLHRHVKKTYYIELISTKQICRLSWNMGFTNEIIHLLTKVWTA
jgi:hypothetical protein